MVINLDTWKRLSPEQQTIIERIAKDMEPGFWESSQHDHEQKVAELSKNGMVVQSSPKALVDAMRKTTSAQWEQYAKPMGPDALKALELYRAEIAK